MRSPAKRTWKQKFAEAFSGIFWGVRGQSSFYVHLSLAALVLAGAGLLGMTIERWAILLLCIAVVMALELLNSSIEQLARCITQEENDHIRRALHISSGAVLLVSVFAALIGTLLFVVRIVELF